jgi:hypothetical protein
MLEAKHCTKRATYNGTVSKHTPIKKKTPIYENMFVRNEDIEMGF